MSETLTERLRKGVASMDDDQLPDHYAAKDASGEFVWRLTAGDFREILRRCEAADALERPASVPEEVRQVLEPIIALVAPKPSSPYSRDDKIRCGSYFGGTAETDFEYLLYALKTCNTFDYSEIMRAAARRLEDIDAALTDARDLLDRLSPKVPGEGGQAETPEAKTFWCIEYHPQENGNPPRWWSGNGLGWTTEITNALWFVRQDDAVRAVHRTYLPGRATEHKMIGSAPSSEARREALKAVAIIEQVCDVPAHKLQDTDFLRATVVNVKNWLPKLRALVSGETK